VPCSALRGVRWGACAVVAGFASLPFLAGCAYAGNISWTEKVSPLKPSITFVKASFLTGEIEGLRVVERIQPGTEELVGAPLLEATLTVSNDSRDHAARLLGGKVEYIDGTGKRIPMDGTTFVFRATAPDRLDPGQKVSQPIEIAFPPSALKPDGLREVSLELTYLPMPYETDTVNVPVYLGG
jgi:hypothetical protein